MPRMLPPILRRLLLSSPFAPLLILLALISLVSIAHPRTRQYVPSLMGAGNPAGAAALAAACDPDDPGGFCPIDDPDAGQNSNPVADGAEWTAAKDHTGQQQVAAPPPKLDAPLPPSYAAFFEDGNLPESLRVQPLSQLSGKLTSFLRRPAQSHGEAFEANNAACPPALADELANPDQLSGNREFWERVDSEEIVRRRAELVQYIADKAESEAVVGEAVEAGEERRGLVLTAGNKDTVSRVLTVLKHLKGLGNTLPVEVFHFPDELQREDERAALKGQGAHLVEIKGTKKIAGAWKNFQIKALALLQSSFTELVYLDSDNMPLRKLEGLFDAPLYKKNGRAAFWPDISKDYSTNAVWRVIGEPCTLNEWTFESGQIVLDKAGNNGLNTAALWLAAGMMENHEFWFRLAGGDKDTFRWAFRALDIPHAAAPRWMSALGIKDGERFCGHTTLQYDLDVPARPMFVHSNLLKHLGGGLRKGQVFTHVKRMAKDEADEPSLNYARMEVYTGARGMCLDLSYGNGARDQEVELLPIEEVDKVFEGFEGKWWDEGGKVGGW